MAYHFENIKLEKGMYGRSGRSFSQTLEELDPSEHYRGTALEGMDAFQRQLKRFDIKVKGAGSDMVEKFFHTTDSAVLFPEFVSRVVRQGLEEESILPAVTATVTNFDGMDYRSIASVPTEEQKSLKRVEEGAAIPQTAIRTQENLVRLHKRGRMLVASYEAIRFQRLDLFSVTLRQIGAYIGRMHLQDAIGVLQNGDGNNNGAEVFTVGTQPISGTAGTLSYGALLDFWSQFDPYTMNTMLVSSDVMLALLKLSEFQNPLTGLNFQGTGTLTTPLGANLLRTSAMPAKTLIGLDKNYALEQICGSEITVEYDKLIDRQLERAAITSISGFAKLFPEASKVLKLD
ncbi:phage major capsid protein [uncultured Dysosmobacter sp.]|uniref:phage major capsid protein n=1 Tax=uncultured Dysosmobacter sp. TaxID=2591384 RepID=UPI002619A9E5|nr:phage major capsid protein [uncultured Dysosmobacter sp.]